MKRTLSLISVLLLLIVLTSCFQSRTDLFNIHLEEDTYVLNEKLEDYVNINEKLVTFISLSFRDTNQTILIDDELAVNTMGDYSFKEIKLFEIEFYLGLDGGEPVKYDLIFLGKANPGRSNAYAFNVDINELHNKTSEYRIVVEIYSYPKKNVVQFRFQLSNRAGKGGGLFILRNELENIRDEITKDLEEQFKSFERANYDQEGWTEIFDIYFKTSSKIIAAKDQETIIDLYEQALKNFKDVPLKE